MPLSHHAQRDRDLPGRRLKRPPRDRTPDGARRHGEDGGIGRPDHPNLPARQPLGIAPRAGAPVEVTAEPPRMAAPDHDPYRVARGARVEPTFSIRRPRPRS